jgi:hypothetical protein
LRRDRRRALAGSRAGEDEEEEEVAAAAAARFPLPLSWQGAGVEDDEEEVLMALAGSKWSTDHETAVDDDAAPSPAQPPPPKPPPPTTPTPPPPPSVLRRRLARRVPTASITTAPRPPTLTNPTPWWSPAPTPPWPPSGPGLAEAAAALLRLPLPAAEGAADLARLLGASGAVGTDEEDSVRLAVACVYVPGRIGKKQQQQQGAPRSPAPPPSSPSSDDPPAAYLYYIECPDGLDLAALQSRQQQRQPQPQQQQQQQPVFVSAAEAFSSTALGDSANGGDATPPPPPPTLIIPSSWSLSFDEYADAVLPDPAGGGGGWRSALLAVRGGFSADERQSLFPNAVAAVAQGRAAHNLRHARDLAEFLADARPEVLREHAANLVRVALSCSVSEGGGSGDGANHHQHPLPPQWCLAQLRRKWGDAALRRHGVDVAFVIGLGAD